jgi:ATPase subunit of ABC transporter with duplicated ATPase domains
MPSYWQNRRKYINSMDEYSSASGEERPAFERDPEGLPIGVEIKSLKKSFGKHKVAVAGISVRMYEGEIFALLGRNPG